MSGMPDYNSIYAHVKQLLADNDLEASKLEYMFPFRRRSDHLWRVFMWARRLLEYAPETVNHEAVLTAALFHDAGYAVAEDKRRHAADSAELFRAYAAAQNFEAAFIDYTAWLIANHSCKALLKQADTPLELVLLMEADWLDESGAMSIVWDCLAVGALPEPGFEAAYERIRQKTASMLERNPMVTAGAQQIWAQKQALVESFMTRLACDLGL